MRYLRQRLRRSAYVVPIVMALAATMVLLASGQGGWGRHDISSFAYQVITGGLLVVFLLYQWGLFLKRVTRDNRNARRGLVRHRWVGVAITVLFALHAARFGHVWMTTLSSVIFLVALTGVLNREVLGYRSNAIYLLWLFVHIGLSAALVPLAMVHIWVALAYQ